MPELDPYPLVGWSGTRYGLASGSWASFNDGPTDFDPRGGYSRNCADYEQEDPDA